MTLDGEALRLCRKGLGLTQADTADLSGLTLRTVQHAEGGRRVAQVSARQLCSALGAPYTALLRPPPEVVQARLLEAGYAPPPPPAPWAGREEETQSLLAHLRKGPAVTCCIAGVSGIGKTALAQQVAAALALRFRDGVVWVTAPADVAHAAAIQLEVAEVLGFVARMPNPEMVGHEALHAAFQTQLWSRPRLLVLDDVESDAMVARFVGRAPGWALLTTARRQVAERVDGPVIGLGPLKAGAAAHLIGLHIGTERSGADSEGVRRVAELVGHVPRGLQIAGRVLRVERYTRPSDYAVRLAEALDRGEVAEVGPWVDPDDPDASFAASHAQLRRRLSTDAWSVFGALSVLEGRPFPLEWATAVIGVAEPQARRLLSELSDFYVLNEARASGQGTWFRLDAQAQRVARWVGRERAREATKRLLWDACRRAEALEALPAGEVLRAYQRHAGLWRVCLERAATEAVVTLPSRPPSSPEELPEYAGAVFPEVRLLPRILWSFRALFTLRPHPDGWQWLAAGLALARATAKHLDYGRLAELMAWWLVLTLIDVRGAETWHREAEAAYQRAGCPDDAVRMAMMAAQSGWGRRGPEQSLPLFEHSLRLAEAKGVPGCRRAAALAALATGVVCAHNNPEARQEAIGLFDQAAALCAGEPSPVDRTVWASAVMNASLLRKLDGQPVDERDAAGAWDVLRSLHPDDELGIYFVDTTASVLGLTDPVVLTDQRKRRILLGPPPELVWRTAILLLPVLVFLDETSMGMVESVRGGFEVGGTVLGLTDLVLCLPQGIEIGTGVPLLHPVEPLRALLDDDGLLLASRYLEGVCGPGHPLYLAFRQVAERRGLDLAAQPSDP